MTNERRVLVHPDTDTLAASVAARFITRVVDLLDEREPEASVHVGLTGGSTGISVLAAIAASPARDSVDWARVEFWWGDERFLPTGDPDRNETQARRALLDHIPVDERRVHPMGATERYSDVRVAADAYAMELATAIAQTPPSFDILFLGVGPDGHVASLFPDHASVLESERTVIAEMDSPKPPSERISLTLPVINAAQRVWLVLAGADKAGPLGLALAEANVSSVPVAGVNGRRRTVFFVDQDAASELPAGLIARDHYWTSDDG